MTTDKTHTNQTAGQAQEANDASRTTGADGKHSAWSRRIPVIVLSLAGFAIAMTLTLFQLDVLDSIWDPFFGDGSRRVLTSSVSQALPIPDASLGAVAYLLEAIMESLGGTDRWHKHPWIVAMAALIAGGLGLAAIGLIAAQALVVGAFCTLCLCSAAISLIIAALVAPEAVAAVRALKTRRRHTSHKPKHHYTAAHSDHRHTSRRPVYDTATDPEDPASRVKAEIFNIPRTQPVTDAVRRADGSTGPKREPNNTTEDTSSRSSQAANGLEGQPRNPADPSRRPGNNNTET